MLSVFDQFSSSIWSIFAQHLINILVNFHPPHPNFQLLVSSFCWEIANYPPSPPPPKKKKKKKKKSVISFEFLLKNCKFSNNSKILSKILGKIHRNSMFFQQPRSAPPPPESLVFWPYRAEMLPVKRHFFTFRWGGVFVGISIMPAHQSTW